MGIFSTLSRGDSLSSDPEKTAPRRRGEEPGCIEVLQQRAGSLNVKIVLLTKEKQISQVKEFAAFLRMGRCVFFGFVFLINLFDCTGSYWGMWTLATTLVAACRI